MPKSLVRRAIFLVLLVLLLILYPLISGLVAPNAAYAINIQWNWDPLDPPTLKQQAALAEAAGRWEFFLRDPITVTIDVEWDVIYPAYIIASTSPCLGVISYSIARQLMLDDAWTSEELAAINQLPVETLPVQTSPSTTISDDKCLMSTANARALDISVSSQDPDAVIIFNDSKKFDYDRGDGIKPDEYDFVTIAAHEIGHVLGFISSTDKRIEDPGWEDLHATPLDLWRFGMDSGVDITYDDRKCFAGAAWYHDSIHNGHPFSWGMSVVDPACGASGGYCQASHWLDGTPWLMDPTSDFEEVKIPCGLDLYAHDYIGYDLLIPRYPINFVHINHCVLYGFPPWCFNCPRLWLEKTLPHFLLPPELGPMPEDANVGVVLAMSVSDPVTGAHMMFTGVAWAKFAPPLENQNQAVPRSHSFPSIGEDEILQFINPQYEMRPRLEYITPMEATSEGQGNFNIDFPMTVAGIPWDNNLAGFNLALRCRDPNAQSPFATGAVFFSSQNPNPPTKAEDLYERTWEINEEEDNHFRIRDWDVFNIADTDGDGWPDIFDNCKGAYNPTQTDSNGNGEGDVCDTSGEIDGDGLADIIDPCPWDKDCDDDGLTDGNTGGEDLNANGIVDLGETDPANPDSDGDGLLDGTEMGLTLRDITEDTDPTVFVSDADPFTTTDPLNADSDGDGQSDGVEDANRNGRVDEEETDPATFTAQIDIKPGSDSNCVNNDGNGVISMAILGSALLDTAQVDPATVSLEGLSVKVVGKADKLLANIKDVNADGHDDLVVQIQDAEGAITAGDTRAMLQGTLYDGTSIEGYDTIRIVPSFTRHFNKPPKPFQAVRRTKITTRDSAQ